MREFGWSALNTRLIRSYCRGLPRFVMYRRSTLNIARTFQRAAQFSGPGVDGAWNWLGTMRRNTGSTFDTLRSSDNPLGRRAIPEVVNAQCRQGVAK
jgi:hypothetical protein